MKIHKTVNPVAYENTYYLEGDQHLIVVDPGSHWEAIRKTIETINKPVCAILLTHTHYDHIMSLDLVRDTYGNPPVYVAESEASWLYTPVDNLSVSLDMTIWQMSSANQLNTLMSFMKNTRLKNSASQSYQLQATLSVEFHWFSQMDTWS